MHILSQHRRTKWYVNFEPLHMSLMQLYACIISQLCCRILPRPSVNTYFNAVSAIIDFGSHLLVQTRWACVYTNLGSFAVLILISVSAILCTIALAQDQCFTGDYRCRRGPTDSTLTTFQQCCNPVLQDLTLERSFGTSGSIGCFSCLGECMLHACQTPLPFLFYLRVCI